ncbi:MAG: hypothetical protein IJU80_01870 [Lachnospiraceae bacterium]|nr:hypothetical protein [Lachnospiraceae bacterium]
MGLINALLSYGVVLLCFVLAGAVAVCLGIFLRKHKDASLNAAAAAEELLESKKTEES